MNKEDITIHCVCKNEPFIYYAIKSVYDYCKTILLYDTGSNDKYTLQDIKTLLDEDIENKIIYTQDLIEYDESAWTANNYNGFMREHRDKRGVPAVRQRQVEDTNTKYFMVVDGDEVHYRETMENILDYELDEKIIMAQIPLIWFYDLKTLFNVYSPTGRIFKTNKVEIRKTFGDIYIQKESKRALRPNIEEVTQLNFLKPYAHFETYVKPHRRKNSAKKTYPFTGTLPEVMLENDYYIKRFSNGLG